MFEKYTSLYSEEIINALREDNIKILRDFYYPTLANDKPWVCDIPADIEERTTKLCEEIPYIKSVQYDIISPETKETAILRIYRYGYIEVII